MKRCQIPASLIILLILLSCSNGPRPELNNGTPDKPGQELQSPVLECGLDGFTKAIDEHIIDEVEKPFRVHKIAGRIMNDTGGWPRGLPILFEIREARRDAKVRRVYADRDGNFDMKEVKEGRYCFKATVMGWQSQMGTIFVDKKADRQNRIILKLNIGV